MYINYHTFHLYNLSPSSPNEDDLTIFKLVGAKPTFTSMSSKTMLPEYIHGITYKTIQIVSCHFNLVLLNSSIETYFVFTYFFKTSKLLKLYKRTV